MKLTPKDKLNIRLQHDGGNGISKRKLALTYGVSRATIRYIVDDVAREKNNENNKKNYYERKKLNG